MREDKRRNTIVIVSLLMGILVIGIGYAVLASNLDITGSSTTGGATWDVKFRSIQMTSSTTGVVHTESVNGLTATIDVTLPEPGSSITYDVIVENKGTIDATYSGMTPTNLDELNAQKPTQIVWAISKKDTDNTLAKQTGIHTFTITINWPEGDNHLPTGDEMDPMEKSGKITLNYVQKTT